LQVPGLICIRRLTIVYLFKLYKTKRMKVIFTFTLIFVLNSIFSQKDFFKIVKLGERYSISQLESSVRQADWCGYFHKSDYYQLKFDDGTVVELFPMTEDFEIKKNLSEACFQNENVKDNGVYKIHESGVLIRMLSARNTSKN
jgi:hypothetical protein